MGILSVSITKLLLIPVKDLQPAKPWPHLCRLCLFVNDFHYQYLSPHVCLSPFCIALVFFKINLLGVGGKKRILERN